MGCGAQKNSQGLNDKLRAKALEIFRRIDINNSGSIDKDETQKFWKTNFAKVNTQALFNAVDFDKSGQIQLKKLIFVFHSLNQVFQYNFELQLRKDLRNKKQFLYQTISEDEWMAFWEIVKKSGYTDKEIFEELDNLMEGKAWVQFRKVDEFVKRDLQRKNSQVQEIVKQNSKRKSLVQQQQSFHQQ